MKNIREHFNDLYDSNDTDIVMALEQAVYELYADDEESFRVWAKAVGVDLDAYEVSYKHGRELSLTLWIWDLCGE